MFNLLYSLDNYQPSHNTEFVQGSKTAYWHVLTRSERYKYLLRTPYVLNSKCLTLLPLSLHVVNDASDPTSGQISSLGTPVMRKENWLSNSSKAAREKGNCYGTRTFIVYIKVWLN